jgi:hypothetical protein
MSRRNDKAAINQHALAVAALLRVDFEGGTGNTLFNIGRNVHGTIMGRPDRDTRR